MPTRSRRSGTPSNCVRKLHSSGPICPRLAAESLSWRAAAAARRSSNSFLAAVPLKLAAVEPSGAPAPTCSTRPRPSAAAPLSRSSAASRRRLRSRGRRPARLQPWRRSLVHPCFQEQQQGRSPAPTPLQVRPRRRGQPAGAPGAPVVVWASTGRLQASGVTSRRSRPCGAADCRPGPWRRCRPTTSISSRWWRGPCPVEQQKHLGRDQQLQVEQAQPPT
mmetsp:Transcript_89812/g.226610  ORF Transcript_89812/g.226610 Transcript_89812/m.226610 type:complete len:220 (-) Transcript_89812:270-929(-)